MYRPSFIMLYYDQQMHNYFTNYHTPTCFDTFVSSSGSLQSVPCQVTQVFQMQLLYILYCTYYQQLHLKHLHNLAKYWLRALWGWHESVETSRSVIICEIIVHLLVTVQNTLLCFQRLIMSIRNIIQQRHINGITTEQQPGTWILRTPLRKQTLTRQKQGRNPPTK